MLMILEYAIEYEKSSRSNELSFENLEILTQNIFQIQLFKIL